MTPHGEANNDSHSHSRSNFLDCLEVDNQSTTSGRALPKNCHMLVEFSPCSRDVTPHGKIRQSNQQIAPRVVTSLAKSCDARGNALRLECALQVRLTVNALSGGVVPCLEHCRGARSTREKSNDVCVRALTKSSAVGNSNVFARPYGRSTPPRRLPRSLEKTNARARAGLRASSWPIPSFTQPSSWKSPCRIDFQLSLSSSCGGVESRHAFEGEVGTPGTDLARLDPTRAGVATGPQDSIASHPCAGRERGAYDHGHL